MYIITNRKLKKGTGLKVFGKKPNDSGPNELRLVEVTKNSKDKWQASIVKDELTHKEVVKLAKKFNLDIDISEKWYGSLRVACELFRQAQVEEKSILFFVHGYNNDLEDVLKTAKAIQDEHKVIVVAFSWPANGGGKLTGTLSYLSDKADARSSADALNRAVGKLHGFHKLLTDGQTKELEKKAQKKHPDNPLAAQELFTKLTSKKCVSKLNLLCHSMGNYLLKKTLANSDRETSHLIFDNICLVAADANNRDHAKDWVEKLDVRNRIYIVINEKDFALKFSRIKPGKEQKARLGHYLKKLNSDNAYYIDVTGANKVGSAHTYFVDKPIKNIALKNIFTKMFNGESVERDLEYRADSNTYVFKSQAN